MAIPGQAFALQSRSAEDLALRARAEKSLENFDLKAFTIKPHLRSITYGGHGEQNRSLDSV